MFDIESDRNQYELKFIHFYFARTTDQKIKITHITYFENAHVQNQHCREIVEKKEWLQVDGEHQRIKVMFCRFDRTGWYSSIGKEDTHTQNWELGWADEDGPSPRMTPDEIRMAFVELAELFYDQQELQKLKPKKAV